MPCYIIHGLNVISDIELPVPPGPDDHGVEHGRVEVVVELGRVPSELEEPVTYAAGYHVSKSEILFTIPKCARYLISSGRNITIEPFSGARLTDITLYLLGSAFAALLHQRALFPLHGAAISWEHGCVAFLGDSGAGKSTLTGMLTAKGFPAMSDDVLAIHRGDNGAVYGAPSIPTVKLRPDAMRILSQTGECAKQQLISDKHHLNLQQSFEMAARKLVRVYLLRWLLPRDANPEIVRISPFDALVEIRRAVFRNKLVTALANEPRLLALLGALLGQADVYEFRRPMNYSRSYQQIDFLLEHLDATTIHQMN